MALTIDELNIQIAADSKNATRAINNLAKAFERLDKAAKPILNTNTQISVAFNKTSASAEKASNSVKKSGDSAKKSSKSWGSLKKNLLMNILTARTFMGVLQGVANKFANAWNESNEYIETMNLFRVTMGDASDEALKYAETVRNAMGIDISEWMQYQGTFKNLAAGFGVADEAANEMSQNLTQLSYDLSSFFNTSVETAFDKLSSAMAGQVKGLREFGIDTTIASLQEYALSKGIDASVRSMTQAEKSMLRYNYIMEKSIKMQGDMARTIITPANSLRILKAQLTQLTRAFGNIVSVIATQFIPYVQVMVEVITDAANAIAKFFGFNLDDYKADLSGLDLGGGLSEELEDAEESVGGVSNTLKKIKKQLMGFDELNIINAPDTDSGGGSGGASVGGGSGIGLVEGYDFLKGLGDTDELKEKIKNKLSEIATVVSGAYLAIGSILVLTGANIPLGLSLMVLGVAGIATAVAVNWDSMNSSLVTTLTTMTGAIAGFGLVLGAILTFSGAAVPLGIGLMAIGAASLATSVAVNWHSNDNHIESAMNTIQGIVSGGLIALGALLMLTGVNAPLGVAFLSIGAATLATSMAIDWTAMENPIERTMAKISLIVGGALLAVGAFLALTGANIPLGLRFIALGALSLGVTAVTVKWDSLSEKTKNTITIITSVVSGALLAIGAILALTGVALPLGIGLIAAGAVGLASVYALNWDSLKGTVKTVISSIGAILSGASMVMGALLLLSGNPLGMGMGLALIYAGVKGSQKAWKMDSNPITEFVRKMANVVIGVINGVIDAVNKLFHISFKGLSIAGKELIPAFDKQLIHISRISYFEDGGFPDMGQMFIAREAGPELVGSIGKKTAVANNDQIISGIEAGVYRAMTAANSTRQGGSQTIRIVNEIDGDIVGEKVIKYHNGKVMQTGVSPLLV